MITTPDLPVLVPTNSGLSSDLLKLHAFDDSLQSLIDAAKLFPGTTLAEASGDWMTVDQCLIDVRHTIHLIETGMTSETEDPPKNWETILRLVTVIETTLIRVRDAAERRRHHGGAEADPIAQEALSHLPENVSLSAAIRYVEEFRKASVEYEQHKDNFDGFFGVVKALFLIPDAAPETLARQRM